MGRREAALSPLPWLSWGGQGSWCCCGRRLTGHPLRLAPLPRSTARQAFGTHVLLTCTPPWEQLTTPEGPPHPKPAQPGPGPGSPISPQGLFSPSPLLKAHDPPKASPAQDEGPGTSRTLRLPVGAFFPTSWLSAPSPPHLPPTGLCHWALGGGKKH